MKNTLLISLLSFLTLYSFAQISFEKGYFINNDGEKIDCLIKNVDWNDNPSKFRYKLSENADAKLATIEEVKEFSVLNAPKYERFTINIDKSSDDLKDINYERNPKFKEETLFLKVLLEGDATLYYYEQKLAKRFFFKTQNKKTEQLVFKLFSLPENKIGRNELYKSQLNDALKCQSLSVKDIQHINYDKRDLLKLFIQYNECKNTDFTNFDKKKKRKVVHLSFRPGVKYSSFILNNNISDRDYGNKIGFKIGIETEFILPFNNNKWALLFEPIYQSFNSETTINNKKTAVKYQSLDILLGGRHYIFLNENPKIFLNAYWAPGLSPNSSISFVQNSDLIIKTRLYFSYGI